MGHKTKEARNAYGRIYLAKNRDHINAKRRLRRHALYMKNRDKELAYERNRRITHRELVLAQEKEYRLKNRDKMNAQAREWYKLNQEQQRLKKRERYQATKPIYKAYQKAYVQKHYDMKLRPKALIRYRKYGQSHPEMVLLHAARRRARKAGATTDKSADQYYLQIRAMPLVDCTYCKKPISGKKAHIDHIVALSRGGSHTAANLCPSCPRCNLSKHNRLLDEWVMKGVS